MADATFADLLGSDILLHYDASDASSLWEDSGATNAAEDGDAVVAWSPQADASITGMLTGTNGPTYRANYNSTGYAALEFDGVNDRLGIVSGGLPAARFFVIMAYTRISGTSSTIWFRGSIARLARILYTGSQFSNLLMQVGINASYGSYYSPGSATVEKIVICSEVSDTKCKFDCGISGVFGPGDSLDNLMPDQFWVGAGDISGTYQAANIALHEVMYIGANCEWGQVQRAATLMRDKWGVSDESAVPQAGSGGFYNPFHNPVFGAS